MTWTIPNILTVSRLVAAPGLALAYAFFDRPLADWIAILLFILAAVTDYVDGRLARAWGQESNFGRMLDPIADKAMVVIALSMLVGLSDVNPLVLIPAAFILFREVFVSGLREFLGADAGRLKVTYLAKWKTTAQMVAIAVLFLGTGLDYLEKGRAPRAGEGDLPTGATLADTANHVGLALIWVAAFLTAVTGWDYFRKALPFLRDHDRG